MKGNFRCHIIGKAYILIYLLIYLYTYTYLYTYLYYSNRYWVSEKVSSLTFGKSNVSSANILHMDSIPLGESLM